MSVGRRHPGDIPIGDGRWLPWTDLPDGVGGQAFDLDPLLEELAGFWDALETMCLRACCGLDAFDLRSDAIRAAARASGGAAVHSRLVAMRQWVVDAPAATSVTSSRLNLRLHRDLLLALVDHMITSVAACDSAPGEDLATSPGGRRTRRGCADSFAGSTVTEEMLRPALSQPAPANRSNTVMQGEAMSDDEDEDGDGPRPRTLKWRMIYGAIGATLGTLAGFLGGAAWIDVLCWGAAPCFVVGFVGEPLFTLYMQAGDGA